MKVNNNSPKSQNVASQVATAKTKALEKNLNTGKTNAAASPEATLGSTKVNMSAEAQAFQKAKAIASKDTIDEAKVARLQKLIDEGKYKIDSAAVADRLVDEHLQAGE